MNKTCLSDLCLCDMLDTLLDGADLISQVHIQPMEGNMNKYLLIAFVFGNSKTNGIIYGTRTELPNGVKESDDFPGTYYKAITDNHGERKIYRYVPLELAKNFLKDTDTASKILPKVLDDYELDVVMAPATGEVWQLEDGSEILILENGFGAREDGTLVYPQEIDGECVSRGLVFEADD